MTKTLVQLLMAGGIWYFASQGANADYDAAVLAYHNNDYETAYQQLLPLAQEGDSRAQALVAMMYKYGEAVEINYVEAFNWYLASANQGYPPAQYSLAELYEAGKGTEPDPELALYWFTRAAEAGLSRARAKLQQYNLQHPDGLVGKPESWSRDWDFSLPSRVTSEAAASPAGQSSSVSTDSIPTGSRSVDHGYRVQLGAMKSVASAHRLWDQVHKPHPDLFQGQPLFYNSNQVNGESLIKVQVGSFPTRSQARQFCAQIQARGITSGCLIIASQPELDLSP